MRDQDSEINQAVQALRAGVADAFITSSGEVCRLAESDKPYVTFFDAMNEGAVTIDDRGIILHSNPRFAAMVGCARSDLRGHSFSSFIAPEDGLSLSEILAGRRDTPLQTFVRSQDKACPAQLSVREVDAGQHKFYCLVISDLTDRVKTEVELRIAAIAFQSQEGMVVTDPDGVILRVNQAFVGLTGYSAAEAVGRTPAILKSGRHNQEFYADMWKALKVKKYWQGEIWNRKKDGRFYVEWLTISAVSLPNGEVTHFVGAFSEITKNKEDEAKIHRLAYYDTLTELPNRRLLLDRVQKALASSSRTLCYGALLFLDLDNFKALNDSLGHDAGDQLLIEVARRIQSDLRTDDTVARLGGDEFVVMLENLSQEPQEAAAQTALVAEKIRETLFQPFNIYSHEYYCTTSIGVVLFIGQEDNIDTLMKRADMAMYDAKNFGRNVVRFFDPIMQVTMDARNSMEAELRLAIAHRQFQLHYQAQVEGPDNKIIGAEALIRWNHPVKGLVSPAEFIPLAEETDLILLLGKFVLTEACRQLSRWANQPGMEDLSIAVNVSARQFRQEGFVGQILHAVTASGANPRRLKLELTESLLLENVQEIIEKMAALKTAGVGFALDDFGIGYSSLSYLKRLPLDQLKIDQSFVRDIHTDPNDAAIAKTIVTLANSLGLGVIAEGVETAEQRDYLVASGCHTYQGYYFSHPLPIEEFESYVTNHLSKDNTIS
ncbi:MAG TPA: EAL domain-containing protein [Rhodospirillaceae bacterium]|nr:EAL domain-containing protein [Rhodospirillaceae bacterium]